MIYTYPESSHLPRAAGIGSLLTEPLADGEPCKVWAQICPSGSHISAQEPETSQKPKALWKTNRGRRVSVSVGFRQRRHSEKQPEPLTHQIRLSLLYFLSVPSSTSLFFLKNQLHFLLSFFILLHQVSAAGHEVFIASRRIFPCGTVILQLQHTSSLVHVLSSCGPQAKMVGS